MLRKQRFFAFCLAAAATFSIAVQATQNQPGEPEMNEIRRVVTGNVNGKSVFALDEKIAPTTLSLRSEERRVGKECRSRWSPYH